MILFLFILGGLYDNFTSNFRPSLGECQYWKIWMYRPVAYVATCSRNSRICGSGLMSWHGSNCGSWLCLSGLLEGWSGWGRKLTPLRNLSSQTRKHRVLCVFPTQRSKSLASAGSLLQLGSFYAGLAISSLAICSGPGSWLFLAACLWAVSVPQHLQMLINTDSV